MGNGTKWGDLMNTPNIFMDNRESLERQRIGKEHYGNRLHILTLGTFDYIIGNGAQIGIESKTNKDLVLSAKKTKDGRFENQSAKMHRFREQYGTHCYYIIQGNYEDLIKDDNYAWVTPKMWSGIIASINEPKDMKTIFVDNDKMFWTQVESLIYNYNKEQAIREVDVIPTGSTTEERMLQCIDNIGVSKAQRILENYTLHDLYHCSVEDLMTVDGIGAKYATRIVNELQGSESFD